MVAYIRIGGAMIVNCSNLTINNCTFDGNSANIGGAIFSDFENHINISCSKFTFNQAMGCNELHKFVLVWEERCLSVEKVR